MVFSPFFSYASFGAWEFGGDIKWPIGQYSQAPTVIRHPVETEQDAWKLQIPEVKTAGFIPLKVAFEKLSTREKWDNKPFRVNAFGWHG